MVQFTMMNQLGLIFVDGFVIYYIARAIIRKIAKNNKKVQFLLIGLAAALLMSLHYAFFTQYVKETSFLEFYRVERAYTSDSLNKKARQVLSIYHPDKNPNSDHDQFNKVMIMRNVLTDPQYQKLYDRFGEFQYVEQSKAKDYENTKNSLSLNAYINTISFYSVFFIISIVLSYGQRFSRYRILSSFILLGLLLQDLLFFNDVDDKYDTSKSGNRNPKFEVERDIYDDYFPTYAIFERLQLIRILCASLLTSLRLYFDCQVEEPVNRYEDSLDKQIDTIYETILKQTEVLRINPNDPPKEVKEGQQPIVFNASVLIDNKEAILKLKELALKHKEDIPKDRLNWLKKIFKALVFGLFLYQLFNHFFNEDNKNGNNQANNHQHPHHKQQQQQYQNEEEFY